MMVSRVAAAEVGISGGFQIYFEGRADRIF